MKVLTLLAMTALTAVCLASEPKAIGKQCVDFSLQDQFGQTWTWSKHWEGKPTVIIVSDWQGADYVDGWTSQLTTAFSSAVEFVALADVSLASNAPSFMQSSIKSSIRTTFKDSYSNPVMLDFDGTVCRYYHVRKGLPNILFVNASGTVKMHTWGQGTSEHVQAVIKAIERYL